MIVKESGFSNYQELPGGMTLTQGDTVTKGVQAEQPAASRKYSTGRLVGSTQAMLSIPFVDRDMMQVALGSLSGAVGDLANQIATDPVSYRMGYADFLLQSADETFSEKAQIVETLSDNYVAYFFGRDPPVFRYSGILFNTWQDDWRAAFTLLYNEIIRGSRLARKNLLVSLAYDQQIVSGYIMDSKQVFSSDFQMSSQFSFSLLVKKTAIYRLPGTPRFSNMISSQRVIANEEFAGVLDVSPVKRTMRQVGAPYTSSSSRSKPKDQATSTGELAPFDASKTQAQKQKEQNVKDYLALFNSPNTTPADGSGQSSPLFP